MRPPASLVGFALLLGVLSAASPAAAEPRDSWTGEDKLLHFSASAVLAGLGYGVTSLFAEGRSTRAAVGAGTALSFGVGKELYDLSGHGDPSLRDLAWDVVGTGVGTGIALGIDLLLGRATASSASGSGLVVRF